MKNKHYTEEQIIWYLALGLKVGLPVGKVHACVSSAWY